MTFAPLRQHTLFRKYYCFLIHVLYIVIFNKYALKDERCLFAFSVGVRKVFELSCTIRTAAHLIAIHRPTQIMYTKAPNRYSYDFPLSTLTQKAHTAWHKLCSYIAVKCLYLHALFTYLSKHPIHKHAFSPLHFHSFTHVCQFQIERFWMCPKNGIISTQNTQEPSKSIWTKNNLPIMFFTNIPGLSCQENVFTN